MSQAGKAEDKGGQKYTVQPGDTIESISEHFYGNANDYMLIYYANQDKIHRPDEIYPGQEFLIPPRPAPPDGSK
jgi:nucleoid-associated protein YgaU